MAGEHDSERARAEAEAALPGGWTLVGSDRETFNVWGDDDEHWDLQIWAAVAQSPHGEQAAAIALTEADAYRSLARRLRGELAEAPAWGPPTRTPGA